MNEMNAEDKGMQVFLKLFEGLDRLGPGDDAATDEALRRAGPLSKDAHILDIGCGAGASAIELARRTKCRVTGFDFYATFLETLANRAESEGLSDRITTVQGDMAEMPFADEMFDVVWSEGSIYLIGFERGVREWRRLLRPGGVLAASDMVWLTDDPPEEARAFWESEGIFPLRPEELADCMRRVGYEDVEYFILPREAWENYYGPLAERVKQALDRCADDPEALAIVHRMEEEIDLYRRFGDSFGYAFMIGRRAG